MQPRWVDVRAIRPSENAKLNLHLTEEIGVGQRCVDAGVGGCSDCRKIGDPYQAITKRQGEPVIGQDRDCLNTPWGRRSYSSGSISMR